MKTISIEKYQKLIKDLRKDFFKQPTILIYELFQKLKYHEKDSAFFENNASQIVENLRKSSWEHFYPKEKEFTTKMLKMLIDLQTIKNLSNLESIVWFIENFPEHIYALTLSNTQSRRSRAGKEFEAIIELILIGAGVYLDTQGNVGKSEFIQKGLGKMVDIVSPSVVEYQINKWNAVLISAKTTLRERWQEVPEEMQRTGANTMFLVTLDPNISDDVLRTLYETNIRIVTTKQNQLTNYKNKEIVISFEQLIQICKENNAKWNSFKYSEIQKEQILESLKKQINKYQDQEFIKKYYQKRAKKMNIK
ncbi:restriction endonuclease-like domain-containing protein [Mycoplasmopsis gallopavonis]|uniref:Restriction endonuclease-like domain-containing protein n=1 Tax=Mycoplasmopsis gallopavonis TaxID=76629 RepID=A0A449AZG5_9BACT|nr:type II restriction endonuclease [Mycoplasmopsis gallopavonis]VEU72877.1 restriction endonuclease-like domain-containing protein [Mycoplasmopsis gallopavonis]